MDVERDIGAGIVRDAAVAGLAAIGSTGQPIVGTGLVTGSADAAPPAGDGQAVPCDRRGDGSLRFVWQLPYGRIVIDVWPDGAVAVNGSQVPPAPQRAKGPLADAA